MNSALQKRIEKARKLIDEHDYFRILTHYDADGICSAGIVARYLLTKGKRFHVSFFRNVEKTKILRILKNEENAIITDMGSSFVDEIKGNIIVIDHHKTSKDNDEVVHINPHLFGYDGARDACASTLAYYLVDVPTLASYALAGIFGDKQYLNGFKGLNHELIKKLSLKVERRLVLYGNILDAIVYSTEPFFPGLSGRRENVEKLLESLKIPSSKDVESLTDEEKIKIGSYLSLNLIKESRAPSAGRYIVDVDINLGGSIRYLTELIDSAARTDNQSIALSYILGEDAAFEKMELLRKEYKSKVIKAIYKILENHFENNHLIYFFVKDSYLTSTMATIASLYLFSPDNVVISLYRDKMLHISARCSQKIGEKIHLGDILREISQSLGGFGGGHSVAAGATVPVDKEREFLSLVERRIEKSLS